MDQLLEVIKYIHKMMIKVRPIKFKGEILLVVSKKEMIKQKLKLNEKVSILIPENKKEFKMLN